MFNLAPWRYRRVLAVDGGPVERIESGVVSVLGETQHQSNAYLKGQLRRQAGDRVLYGDADGSGTDRFPAVARHKAISECLERWAHAASYRSGKYGFDIDPSSSGMAAFPALFSRNSRERAWGEAVERHSIMSWWSGAANAVARPSRWAGVDVYEVESATPGIKVALLHAAAGQQMHAYAHAAARTLEEAAERATIELVRAQFVISRYERRRPEPSAPTGAGLFERRCLYFAGPEGYARFQSRMQQPKSRTAARRVLFDGEVPGPWTEFACVWRVVLEPAHPDFLDDRDDFFFW